MTCHVRQFYLLIFPLLMPSPDKSRSAGTTNSYTKTFQLLGRAGNSRATLGRPVKTPQSQSSLLRL